MTAAWRRIANWLAATRVLIVIVWSLTAGLAPWFLLGINGTDSLRGLVYLVLKNQFPAESGDAVTFYPPPNRFYPARMLLVKRAMGIRSRGTACGQAAAVVPSRHMRRKSRYENALPSG